jgi:hypothetical protein
VSSAIVAWLCQYGPLLAFFGATSRLFMIPYPWAYLGDEHWLWWSLMFEGLFFAGCVLPIGIRRFRSASSDVRPIEILGWSWSGVPSRLAIGFVGACAVYAWASARLQPGGTLMGIDGQRIAELESANRIDEIALSGDGLRAAGWASNSGALLFDLEHHRIRQWPVGAAPRLVDGGARLLLDGKTLERDDWKLSILKT